MDPDKEPDYSEIKVIKKWPGGGGGIDNRDLEKVPTEISFESGKTMWGYEIPSSTTRHSCFKLLLDEKASKRIYDDPNLAAAVDSDMHPSLPDGKTVLDVTFEYLRLLHNHIMKQLREHVPDTFDSTPIHFVLTVPAIWSHAAQRATLGAAKRAGIGARKGDRITMVSEPEAAGAYCLSEMHRGSGNELKVHTHFLTLATIIGIRPTKPDIYIGGGAYLDMRCRRRNCCTFPPLPIELRLPGDVQIVTIHQDLATYEVSEITPCLRIREAVEGSGSNPPPNIYIYS